MNHVTTNDPVADSPASEGDQKEQPQPAETPQARQPFGLLRRLVYSREIKVYRGEVLRFLREQTDGEVA